MPHVAIMTMLTRGDYVDMRVSAVECAEGQEEVVLDYARYMDDPQAPIITLGGSGGLYDEDVLPAVPEDILAGSGVIITVDDDTYLDIMFENPVTLLELSIDVQSTPEIDIMVMTAYGNTYEETVSA
jgi:hypothetical protein